MDCELIEQGNGGDLIKKSKDLSVIDGFENMPYLAMFGGNVKQSTPSKRIKTEQAFDFWGNSLLMSNDPSIQFNSLTERKLNEVPLTSSGRELIEQAIKKDLQFMNPFSIVKVFTSIVSTDRLLIGIQLTKPDNLQQKEFVYIWDATISELMNKDFTSIGGTISVKIFDYTFDFTFG